MGLPHGYVKIALFSRSTGAQLLAKLEPIKRPISIWFLFFFFKLIGQGQAIASNPARSEKAYQ